MSQWNGTNWQQVGTNLFYSDFARLFVGPENVRMQKTQRRRLHRPAQMQGQILERVWQISHHHFTHLVATGLIQHQAERAFGIMLADEHDGAVEVRTAQFPAVQQELPFQ